jgi:hypothetical protein
LLLHLRIRGALTNGRDWIFLLIKLNDDYDGAFYKQSDNSLDGRLVISEPWPDLILLLTICVIELLVDWNARLKIAL